MTSARLTWKYLKNGVTTSSCRFVKRLWVTLSMVSKSHVVVSMGPVSLDMVRTRIIIKTGNVLGRFHIQKMLQVYALGRHGPPRCRRGRSLMQKLKA
jgi:hypothetical protein